jgi:hypothetical protein
VYVYVLVCVCVCISVYAYITSFASGVGVGFSISSNCASIFNIYSGTVSSPPSSISLIFSPISYFCCSISSSSHDLNWSSLGSSDIDIYTCCLRNLCTPAIWFERAPLLCRVKHSTCATVTTSRAKLYPILVIAAPRAGGRTGSKGVCSKVRTQRRISVDGQKNREEENKRLHFPLCPRSSRPRPMI